MIVFWLFWLVWLCAVCFGAFAANNEPPEVRYFWASVMVSLAILNLAVDRGSEVKAEFQVMTFDGTIDKDNLWTEFKSRHEHCSHTGCWYSDRKRGGCGFAKVRRFSADLRIARGRGDVVRGESWRSIGSLRAANRPTTAQKPCCFGTR